MRQYSAVVLAALFVLGFGAGVAVCADEGATTECRLAFSLDKWPNGMKAVKGDGTISCVDGQSLAVKVRVKGDGKGKAGVSPLTARGVFSGVADVAELIGTFHSDSPVDPGSGAVLTCRGVTLAMSWTSSTEGSTILVKKVTLKRSN